MDADLQHPPEMVPSLVSLVHKLNYDIAIASRYARGSRVSGWSFPRRVLSKLGVLLARLLLPEARVTSDPLSGFFALRKDLVPNAVASGRGFKVLLPLLKHALQENPTLRVVDASFTFHPRSRGKSKLGIGTVVSDLLQLLRLSGYRPFRFAAVGSLGTVVNLGAMYLAYKVLGLPYVVGSVVGIEASITFNFTLHEGWTFRERRWRLSSGILRRLAGFHGSSAASILTTFTSAVMFKEVLGVEPLIGQFV
ncbi:TPA: glycosyltransferase family 2 protein, partial [Candidatus Micrarchaeota archaeon]|nr:glycosyltransferase family 2 protein [Candidatus Micrarchaeota archaeon]